ncbi:MAG: cell division protein ZapA [Anaerostipes sp.]|nr:cell division protein ZapA [Anaerostipes sp.]
MAKDIVEVIIDGKIFYLGGEESEEYMHKVASYLNHKTRELKSADNYRKLPPDMQSFHLALSVADDYMRQTQENDELEQQLEQKEGSLYEMKQQLVQLQIKRESLEKQLDEYRKKVQELEKDQI